MGRAPVRHPVAPLARRAELLKGAVERARARDVLADDELTPLFTLPTGSFFGERAPTIKSMGLI